MTDFTAFKALNKAVWAWGDASNGANAQEILAFVKKWNIGTIWMSVGRRFDETNMRDQLPILRDAGIKVHALMGEPGWPTQLYMPKKLSWAFSEIKSFDGIHLDIEPHAWSDWETPEERDFLMKSYFDFLNKYFSKMENLTLSVVPQYGTNLIKGIPFISALGLMADELAVMAYHTNPLTAMRWTEKLTPAITHTPFWSGISVAFEKVPKQSYQFLPLDAFINGAVAQSKQPNCRGVAINDLTSLMQKLAGVG